MGHEAWAKYNFRKKLRRENDHKLQKGREKLSGGHGEKKGTLDATPQL